MSSHGIGNRTVRGMSGRVIVPVDTPIDQIRGHCEQHRLVWMFYQQVGGSNALALRSTVTFRTTLAVSADALSAVLTDLLHATFRRQIREMRRADENLRQGRVTPTTTWSPGGEDGWP